MTQIQQETPPVASASSRPSSAPKNDAALIVFTRGAVAQSVKTRMAPALNKAQRVMLHRALLQDLATTCVELSECGIDIIVSAALDGQGDKDFEPARASVVAGYAAVEKSDPCLSAVKSVACLEDGALGPFSKCNARYMGQAPASFAGRMVDAFERALALGYRRVVMVGSDCPELTGDTVQQAFELLKCEQAVFGPATDGGFYLAGLSMPVPELFALKGYGTSHALDAVEARAQRLGIEFVRLPVLSDIDTLFDLQGLYARLRQCEGHRRPRSTWNILEHLRAAGVPVDERPLSVIVPLYNEVSQVPQLTRQLRALEPYCELVLVDGGSTDGTRALLEREFPVLNSPKGRGAQLNRGVAASHGELLLFLHADSCLPQGAIEELRRVLETSSFGCFGIRFDSKAPAMLCCSFLSNFRAKYRHLPFGDQGFFMERSLFDELGGFREISLMEDYQFSLDLRERGIKPVLARKRIRTSSRRYAGGLLKQLSTMVQMGRLRKMYRDGADPAQLAALYRDIR